MTCPHCKGVLNKIGRDVLTFAFDKGELIPMDKWVCIKCGNNCYTDVPESEFKTPFIRVNPPITSLF